MIRSAPFGVGAQTNLQTQLGPDVDVLAPARRTVVRANNSDRLPPDRRWVACAAWLMVARLGRSSCVRQQATCGLVASASPAAR
jgi:hypothetical protein